MPPHDGSKKYTKDLRTRTVERDNALDALDDARSGQHAHIARYNRLAADLESRTAELARATAERDQLRAQLAYLQKTHPW